MITAIVVLLILGIVCWFVNTTPIAPIFKNGIFVLAAIFAILVIANALGANIGGSILR